MGIRDAPRHTVTVQRRTSTRGSAGQAEWTNDGDPVVVHGNLHPATTDEIVQYGVQGSDLRRFHCLAWPGDLRSVITFEETLWEVAAPAQHFDMSPRTAHWEVLLRRRPDAHRQLPGP